jgi:hypothetical protein
MQSDSPEHGIKHHHPADRAPPRFDNGMAPGTAIKWVYRPRWHLDVKSDRGLIVADGGQTVADAERTIIDTLLAHGRAGMAELALAAEVDLSDAETTAALGTLEAAGIVEQVGDDTPQWRVVAEKEVAACEQ